MSVKRIDPSQKFKIISQFDESLADESKYDKYEENFDESQLQFKPELKPDRFIVRGIENLEMANLNDTFLKADPQDGMRMKYTNRGKMLMEIFDMCCLGVEDKDGNVSKITSKELQAPVVIEIASHILNLSSLGKNEKK